MLRVLHVAETLPGGIATYLRELVSLQAADQSVDQVRILAPQNQLSHLSALPSDILKGYLRSGRNLVSLVRLALAIRQQIKEFRPQIIHLHSSFAGAVGRLMRPLLPTSVKLIYCPHGWGFSREDYGLARRIYILIERWLAARADAWVAISQHEAAAASSVGIDIHHMSLIYNGIAETPTLSSGPPASCTSGLRLLFVGRHDRQKGLDILLAAMAQLGDIDIRLYVAGAETQKPVQTKAVLRNVVWLGWRSELELVADYRACDAVVVPSRWEGFGLVAIEAMREGRAVIASQSGALSEVVGDCGAYFPIEDVSKLVTLLRNLSAEQLAYWGRRARTRYEVMFRSDRMHRETIELYQALQPADSGVS